MRLLVEERNLAARARASQLVNALACHMRLPTVEELVDLCNVEPATALRVLDVLRKVRA